MTLRGIKRSVAMFWVNHILTGTRCFAMKRRLLRFAGHTVGENTKVVGPVFCTGKLQIGRDCWIGRDLSVEGNGTVSIGDSCDIGPQVTFLTGGHALGNADRRAGQGETYEISVGSGSWIGARSTVIGPAQIGASCVIAACACVISHVPANTLAGGVPAKKIREL